MLKKLTLRFIRLIFGLTLYSVGSYLTIQANIGLAPWEAFSIGVSETLKISYSSVMVGSSMLILIVDVLLREKIGFGTILNAVLVGIFTDILMGLEVIPKMQSFLPGVALLLLGQVVICLASFFYIGAAAGCGPRDSLMVALGKRIDKVPIGAVRGALEGCVLVVGWILGAKVGVGTIISVFGIGFILQFTFKLLRFDVKSIEHESCVDTIKSLRRDKSARSD